MDIPARVGDRGERVWLPVHVVKMKMNENNFPLDKGCYFHYNRFHNWNSEKKGQGMKKLKRIIRRLLSVMELSEKNQKELARQASEWNAMNQSGSLL